MSQDDRNRGRANLAAAIFVIGLIALSILTVRLFIEHERLQRCLDQRRSDCYTLNAPPPEGIRAPTR